MMPRISKTLLFALALTGILSATTVTYNPKPTTDTGWNGCGNFPGYSCRTLAYFDSPSLDDQHDNTISPLFQTAWDAWDASGGGQGWTLADDVTDPGGTFTVTTATAQQFSGVTLGGLTINITISGLDLPTPGADQSIVWVQGLLLNYTPGPGTIVAPYYAMDTATLSGLTCGGTVFCPPAYPYQYADDHFYDQPKDYYQTPGSTQAFFDANAYIALRDTATDTLTLYDGVSYGFQNYVSPEPASLLLLVSGLLGVAVSRRRRAQN